MDIQSAIKSLINDRRTTYEEVGCKLGGVTRQCISSQLNRNNDIAIGRVLKYLDILGCDLVIRSREQDDRIDWIVTGAKKTKRDA